LEGIKKEEMMSIGTGIIAEGALLSPLPHVKL
jgi:hypothetical protein